MSENDVFALLLLFVAVDVLRSLALRRDERSSPLLLLTLFHKPPRGPRPTFRPQLDFDDFFTFRASLRNTLSTPNMQWTIVKETPNTLTSPIFHDSSISELVSTKF